MINSAGSKMSRWVFLSFALLALASHQAGAQIADAAMRNDLAAVKDLIKKKVNVNEAQGDGMTAIHWAAENGNLEIAKALIAAKANQNVKTKIGSYTPLHLAIRSGSAELVKVFVAGGADVKLATTNTGVTPLHLAASAGNPEVVALLLEKGADANAREPEYGQTPLMFAAAEDRAAAIKVLLSKGADPNLVSRTIVFRDASAADAAVTRRRNEILNAGRTDTTQRVNATPAQLQAAIAESRKVYLVGEIPAGPAARERSPADTAADPDDPPPTGLVNALGGFTALHHAAREGSVESARALIEGGAKLDVPSGGDKSTPLMIATINGQFDAAMVLIEKGANPNLASEAGTTPLYGTLERRWANRTRYPQPIVVDYQKASHLEVLEALLKAGANPNVALNRHLYYMTYTGCGNSNCGLEQVAGATPFWRAAYATDVDAMRLLAKYGADANAPTRRVQAARGGGGGGNARGGGGGNARGGGAGGRGQAAGDSGQGAATAVAANANASGAAAVTANSVLDVGRAGAAGAAAAGGGGGPGGPPAPANAGAGDPSGVPLPPDGAQVYPIHAAAGVGYGQGFAGNSHRHAPDGWIPAVKFLIEEMKVDVNLRDVNGYTPLHHAAARGDNELIKYLVSKGADVKAVSRRGQTTADMANGPVSRITPYHDTVRLLESLGSLNNHRCASC